MGFVEREELADSERFYCNSCKSKQPSTKQFRIRRLPTVLCLHIKRFRWTTYARTKIDTFIEFPLNGLDMSSYLPNNLSGTRFSNSGSSLYDLAAVIVHHGTGAGSGHYTAFATNNKAWLLQRLQCEGGRLSDCQLLQGLHTVLCTKA